MTLGVVQRRGVPQVNVLAERFGQETLGAPVELPPFILPVAKVPRTDPPAMGGTAVGALAANRSMIQLLNPASSNTELLVKRIWASAGADATVNISTHDAPLATLATTRASMIRREGSNQTVPIGQIRHTKGAAVGSVTGFFFHEGQTGFTLDFSTGDGDHFDGFVLQPGRGILLDPGADNITMRATFEWLERQGG